MGAPTPSQQCQTSPRVETAQAECAVLAAPGWVGAGPTHGEPTPLVPLAAPGLYGLLKHVLLSLFHVNTSHPGELTASQPRVFLPRATEQLVIATHVRVCVAPTEETGCVALAVMFILSGPQSPTDNPSLGLHAEQRGRCSTSQLLPLCLQHHLRQDQEATRKLPFSI